MNGAIRGPGSRRAGAVPAVRTEVEDANEATAAIPVTVRRAPPADLTRRLNLRARPRHHAESATMHRDQRSALHRESPSDPKAEAHLQSDDIHHPVRRLREMFVLVF